MVATRAAPPRRKKREREKGEGEGEGYGVEDVVLQDWAETTDARTQGRTALEGRVRVRSIVGAQLISYYKCE